MGRGNFRHVFWVALPILSALLLHTSALAEEEITHEQEFKELRGEMQEILVKQEKIIEELAFIREEIQKIKVRTK